MEHKNTLIFLYMVPHTGHQKAAEAVMQAVYHMDPQYHCVSIDAITYAYPVLGKVVNRMYLQILKTAPMIWDYLYDNPDVEEMTREARGLLTFLSSFRSKKLLSKYNPAALICTQAVPATALASLKRKGHLKVPLICIITDFGVHTYWIHPEVDLYLVPHEDIKMELIRRGIKEDNIRVTGIPVDPKFGETDNSFDEKHALKLNMGKKTILLMGGSRGLGAMEKIVEELLTLPKRFEALIICGKNKRLQKKLLKITRGEEGFQVFGYVKDLPRFMTAADLIITKPGGLTCSEALAKKRPLILTSPLPGQEERNVRFLLKHRVARLARNPEDVRNEILSLLKNPQKLTYMQQQVLPISKPHSSWEAARLIFDIIQAHERTSGYSKN